MFSRIMDLKIIVEGVNLKARSDFLKLAAGFGFETNSEAANLWTTCGGSSQVHLNKLFSIARSYKTSKLTVYDGCLQS